MLLSQHEPRTAAVEEGEVPKGVQVRKSKHLAIPLLGLADVPHGSGDLAYRTQEYGCIHISSSPAQRAPQRRAEPLSQLFAVLDSELRDDVGNMEFDGVGA